MVISLLKLGMGHVETQHVQSLLYMTFVIGVGRLPDTQDSWQIPKMFMYGQPYSLNTDVAIGVTCSPMQIGSPPSWQKPPTYERALKYD